MKSIARLRIRIRCERREAGARLTRDPRVLSNPNIWSELTTTHVNIETVPQRAIVYKSEHRRSNYRLFT